MCRGGGEGRCISVGGSYIRGAYNRMYFLFTEGLISRGGALISDSLRYTSFDHTTSVNVLSCPHEMHPF